MASKRKAGAPVERVRRRRSPEQAQEEILGAAARLFLAHGPERVSLMDVAREAGVSHALVSHYFGTFDALVETVVLRHVGGRLGALLERLRESGPRPTEELVREVFAVHEDPLFARVGLWALLRSRTRAWAVAPSDDGGPHDVAMALLERHFAPLHAARGLPPPSPTHLSHVLHLVAVTSHGHALSKHVLGGEPRRGGAGGDAESGERGDEAFSEQFARMVEAYLAEAVRRPSVSGPPTARPPTAASGGPPRKGR